MFDKSKAQKGKVESVRKKTKDRCCSNGLNCNSRRKMMIKKTTPFYQFFIYFVCFDQFN